MYLKYILFFFVVNAAVITAKHSIVKTTCPRDKFSRAKDSLELGDKNLQKYIKPEKILVPRKYGQVNKEVFVQKFDNNKKIKLIMVTEDESLGGCVSILQGGIGEHDVKLEFKSSPSRPIAYSVWIYAK